MVHSGGEAAQLAAVVEANGAEFLLAMGRAGGGEEHDEAGLHWIVGGSPIDYQNAVVAARLDGSTADRDIAAFVAALRRHGVPGSWHLGPGMTPPDLAERLLAHGFFYAGDDIGMAVALDALPAAVPTPPGFEVEQVQTDADLADWTRTLAHGFGEGPGEAEWVGSIWRRLGLGHPAWRHYLGRLDGEPVATATLFLAAGAAGIYFVFTRPETRRRGIGAAMTLAALDAGRAAGASIGVLGASSMGEPVYRRLGFVECCRIGLFEWAAA